MLILKYLQLESCFIAGIIRISATMHCTMILDLGVTAFWHISRLHKMPFKFWTFLDANAMFLDPSFPLHMHYDPHHMYVRFRATGPARNGAHVLV